MYGFLTPKLIAIAATSVAIFLSGWFINGWRWEAKYVALEKSYAEAMVKAQQEARRKELELIAKAEQQERVKNETIDNIRTQLDRALIELRKRPSRVSVPGAAPSQKGATGAELYAQDAEFLIREAARADRLAAELKYCQDSYESVRQSLIKGNP